MVQIENLSIDSLRLIGSSYQKIVVRQPVKVEMYGYVVANQNGFYLFFKNDPSLATLEDGTKTYGDGWLIVNSATKQGVTFWSYTGKYSEMSDSLKEEVVVGFNSVAQGEDVVTENTGDKFESVNEKGETIAEERERESTETETDNFQGRVLRTSQIIREVDETLEYTSSEYGASNLQRKVKIELIENTTETWQDDSNEYRVDNVSYTVNGGQDGSRKFDSQLEAEEYFQELYDKIAKDFNESAEESARMISENETTSETFDEVQVYWKESNLSFEEMLQPNIPNNERAFKNGTIYRGGFDDSVKWSEGGNKIELIDYDTPRITAEGVSENLSGGLKFEVNYGWRVSLTVKTNSMTFTNSSISESEFIDGVSVDGREFEVVMYGGDILQIDIDNEREGLYPFVITSAGSKWSSVEEIDDEVFITMDKAEQLYFHHIEGVREIYSNPPKQGEIKSETIESDVRQRVVFNGPYLSSNLDVNSEIKGQLSDEMSESLRVDKGIALSEVKAEGSFYSPEDLSEDVGDLTSGVWDSLKWWIIGGVVAIVVIGGVYVFINARARGAE